MAVLIVARGRDGGAETKMISQLHFQRNDR
jgi:hypothetical protein